MKRHQHLKARIQEFSEMADREPSEKANDFRSLAAEMEVLLAIEAGFVPSDEPLRIIKL